METPLNFNRKKEIREEIRTTRLPPTPHTQLTANGFLEGISTGPAGTLVGYGRPGEACGKIGSSDPRIWPVKNSARVWPANDLLIVVSKIYNLDDAIMKTPLNFNRKKKIREEIRTTRLPHTHRNY
jgi:hypothetical protein